MTARTVTVDADDLEELLELVAQGLAALEWTTRARLRAEEYADVPIMGMWALPGGGAESMPPLGATEQRLIERVRNALRGGGRGTGGPDTSAQRSANVPPAPDTAPPPAPCRKGDPCDTPCMGATPGCPYTTPTPADTLVDAAPPPSSNAARLRDLTAGPAGAAAPPAAHHLAALRLGAGLSRRIPR